MFEAYATPTVRGYHPSDKWSRYPDVKIATGETLPELKKKLASHYGKSWNNKRPMYRDMKDGSVKRTGWVIGMRVVGRRVVGMRMVEGRDKWLQQDWVSIVEIKEVEL